MFDRRAYKHRRDRAVRLKGDAFLARDAAAGLAHRIAAVNRRFTLALDIDSNPGAGDELLPLADKWERASIGPDETLGVAPGRYDLIVSVLSLHAVNDLPGVLAQIRQALRPDGLFLAALFGGSTLMELRHAFAAAESEVSGGISPRVSPFADVRDLGSLLQRAGFALPVADVERTIVRYPNVSKLIADLRDMGETNILAGRRKGFTTRKLLLATCAKYYAQFSDPDNRLRATFEIAYLTGWSPHESQQQPLRPGSAKVRLADALGTSEHSLKRD